MTKLIQVLCENCQVTFERPKNTHDSNVRKGRKHFCSRQCSSDYRNTTETVLCLECNSSFTRSGSITVRNPKKFCSHSCSATYNNTNRTLKNKVYCPTCNKNKIDKKSESCQKCLRTKKDAQILSQTLQELRGKYSISQYHAKIRGHARSLYLKTYSALDCLLCGRTRGVDVCHKKDVKDFNELSTLAEVNHISNLVALCKNHHYDFDNQYLSTEELNIINHL